MVSAPPQSSSLADARWSSAACAAAALAALVIALASGFKDLPGTWDWLSGQRSQFEHLSARERAEEPGTAQLLPVDAFDFFRSKLREGDRYYLGVKRGGFAAGVDRATAGRIFGRFYLLPAMQVDSPAKADVVLTVGHRPAVARRRARRRREVRRRQLLRRPGAALTGSLAGLLFANVLYLVIGIALLPLLRIARTRAELASRLGLAYILGLAATGALTAHLALIGIPVGPLELVVLALLVGVPAWRRVRRLPTTPSNTMSLGAEASGWRRGSSASGASSRRSCCSRTRHTRSRCGRSLEWDGWAIWAMKARALYDFGGVGARRLHDAALRAAPAPAAPARARGDGLPLDGRLRRNARPRAARAARASAFAAGLWTLLRERVPAALAGASILAIVAADSTLRQLAANLADIPLAFFVALGVVALARTLLDENAGLLPFAAVHARCGDAHEARGPALRGRGARSVRR